MHAPLRWMAGLAIAAAAVLSLAAWRATTIGGWSTEELAVLRSLSISSLDPLAPDPSNRYGDDPRAAALGHRLFFDPRLSGTGTISCRTCHLPDRQFQDGVALAQGVGRTTRRTMPIVGTAHSTWLFWDGRKDSQWSQALVPLESPVEHGGDRTQYAHLVARAYRSEYEAIFGPLPSLAGLPAAAGPVDDPARRTAWNRLPPARREDITRLYANIGKAIAAYERQLQFGASRFDRYVEAELAGRRHTAESRFTRDEIAGLRLFIGKANCINCHNGALFTDNSFHNTGVPAVAGLPPDDGRRSGVRQVLQDEFNCLGPYSDAAPEDCAELRFVVADGHELLRAYKPPTLRNIAERPPYMHAGQHATLSEVLRHYNTAPDAPAGHSELRPLRLSAKELRQLEAFLRTLSGPITAPAGMLAPP